MDTDKACELLGLVRQGQYDTGEELKEACTFAIQRMREIDSLLSILKGVTEEFSHGSTR